MDEVDPVFEFTLFASLPPLLPPVDEVDPPPFPPKLPPDVSALDPPEPKLPAIDEPDPPPKFSPSDVPEFDSVLSWL